MKVNELRIGNCVNHGNVIKQLDAELFLQLLKYTTPFEPIPLNEEWLLKFGFERNGKKLTFWKIDLVEDEEGIFSFDEARIYIDVKYVHQLQNLYFALTGEELVVKE